MRYNTESLILDVEVGHRAVFFSSSFFQESFLPKAYKCFGGGGGDWEARVVNKTYFILTKHSAPSVVSVLNSLFRRINLFGGAN